MRDRDDRGRDRDEGRGRDRERSSRDDDRGSRDRGRDRDDDRGGRDRGRDEGRGRSGGRGFSYQSRKDSGETARRAEAKGASQFDRILKDVVKAWTPNDKDNTIRPLPPTWDGAKHYGLDVFVHYGVGPDNETYLCPKEMLGKPCPICEERAEVMRNSRDEDDEKYAADLKPKARVLMYLVDRDHPREGAQAWTMPWGLDKDFCALSRDKRTGEVFEVDHPEEGYDLMFTKTGQGKKTKYEAPQLARRSSSLDDDDALAFATEHPLPDMLIHHDYDYIKAKFAGGSSSEQRSRRDRDDDDRPARGRDDDRSSSSRGRDDDDDRGTRGRGGRDDDRGRDSRNDDPTWEEIHDMSLREMEDLIDAERLGINPKEARNDDDLADWICEEMKIEKPAPSRGRERERDDPPPRDEGRGRARERDDGPPVRNERLESMRRQRGD